MSKNLRFAVALLLVLSGCTRHHLAKYDPYYTRMTPRYYEATETPLMFQYSVEDAQWTIEHWFAPMSLVGHLDFNGSPPSPRDFYHYGQSVGADVIVVGATKTEERTVEGTRTVYDTTTSTVYDASGDTLGRVQTQVPRNEPYRYTVFRYDFVVSFFRSNDDDPAWWDLRIDSTDLDAPSKKGLNGEWSDGDYVVQIRSTTRSYLGFVTSISERKLDQIAIDSRKMTGNRRQWWRAGDLKLMIDKKSMDGLWLMSSKAPVPCKYTIEKKTGYLKAECGDGSKRTLERLAGEGMDTYSVSGSPLPPEGRALGRGDYFGRTYERRAGLFPSIQLGAPTYAQLSYEFPNRGIVRSVGIRAFVTAGIVLAQDDGAFAFGGSSAVLDIGLYESWEAELTLGIGSLRHALGVGGSLAVQWDSPKSPLYFTAGFGVGGADTGGGVYPEVGVGCRWWSWH
jgi:hypothetical protein